MTPETVMAETLSAAPAFSTPDTHILNETSNTELSTSVDTLSDEELEIRYEISRTIDEIRKHKWRSVALQFPDGMLPHSARIYQKLAGRLKSDSSRRRLPQDGLHESAGCTTTTETSIGELSLEDTYSVKLTILADTSYGACCVDEIAAEHVDAEAVVHYGRACLSPTARLPVLHIFTDRRIDLERTLDYFERSFPDKDTKVVVTADVPFDSNVAPLYSKLKALGYTSLYEAAILHDPSSPIPNRTVPQSVTDDSTTLSDWHLFHIAEPPTSLLLTLISSMASIRVFDPETTSDPSFDGLEKSTSALLRRRYALVTSLATVSVWGILVNTLSVKNYLHMVDHIKKQIANAGKKSYLFVVGKINAAKVANFSEIGGWVVVGCWESSLIDSKDFYKPIITPFELELALSDAKDRVWTGKWRSDFDSVLEVSRARAIQEQENNIEATETRVLDNASDEESDEAPEFDLRTGRYVSKTRPMDRKRLNDHADAASGSVTSQSLMRRANGDIVAVNGVASPAAQFLAEKRTWQGLGSDFEIKYEEEEEGDLIEEGRTGIAQAYVVGDSAKT